MSKRPSESRARAAGMDPFAADAIDRVVESFEHTEDSFDRRLLREMIETVYRLQRDKPSTGDLKVLNATLKELRYAFKVFRPYRDKRKVAIFGSARTPKDAPDYRLAVRTARLLRRAEWMVITGAASGIMQAGNEGAGKQYSFGVNIRLPFEQEANPVIRQDSKLVNFKYFFSRKVVFIKESDATMLFPGGFGTLDEGFESLTLVQTGKSNPRPIVMVEVPGGKYWSTLLPFLEQELAGGGMIADEDRSLYRMVYSAEEARDEILKFFSRYHSMRYIGDLSVIRMTSRLTPAQVRGLGRTFGDIVESGGFRQCGALPVEVRDQDHPALPRLVFRFNRSSFGRLRQLIDAMNSL